MATKAFEKATRDRDNIKSNIGHWETKLKGHVDGSALLSLRKVIQYIGCVTVSHKKLAEAHEEIYTNIDPKDVDPHNKEYLALCDRLDELDYQLLLIQDTLQVIPAVTATTTARTPDIRLPTLDLPTFDGTLTDWMPFRDMFLATIHNNPNLSDAQKLTYLKSSLIGEASRQVKSISVTDQNYCIAWQLIKDRYHNDRELFFSIMRRLMGQQLVQANSAASLRSLVDVTKESTRSLQILKLPVDKWDGILLYVLFQKLDPVSKELWESGLKDSTIPPLQEFLDFVEQRARALAAGGTSKSHPKPSHGGKPEHENKRVNVHHAQATVCKFCSENHYLFKCAKFLNISVSERCDFVKKQSLCFNCLRENHNSSQCFSTSTCRTCKKKHNTLLHKGNEPAGQGQQQNKPEIAVSLHSNDDNQIEQSILATAVVKVEDSSNQQQLSRLLNDNGSMTHLVTEACVQRLGLPRSHTSVEIVGLASTSCGTAKGIATLTISPHFMSKESFTIRALIVKKITGRLPNYPCDPTVWPHIQGLELADPNFHQPGEIDILLGAGMFWNILLDGEKRGPPGTPIARRSTLGWLVGGCLDSISTTKRPQVMAHYSTIDLDKRLQQFWEVESVPITRTMTPEEKDCETHFNMTHRINASTGRFTVKLPFKNPPQSSGSSRNIAIRYLKQLESRLVRNPEFRIQYNAFMNEYISLGHMMPVPCEEVRDHRNPICYTPHHFVTKDASTTTKFRVVFHASIKLPSGKSLNDELMVGPTLQDTMFDIIIRFRKHVIAFTADVAKMYRQIRVTDEDADMQRIVWRDDPSQPIQDYKLLTVTYGTASAPYLATKVLQQLAINHQESLPLGAQAALNDTYVDDVMSGASTPSEAIEVKSQLLELMDRGGFSLRKWSSNCPELLSSLPPEFRETQPILQFEDNQTIKALGIHWCTKQDLILFKVTLPASVSLKETGYGLTKRKILSEMSMVYDLPGYLAPVIIKPKILMQELWKMTIPWDEVLPLHIQQQWVKFKNDLPCIEQIRMKRCVVPPDATSLSLVGFCDASELAYAAAVYVRADHHDRLPTVSLVAAKTRVAPVKQISLPRLELCGAVVLSQLMTTVNRAFKMPFDNIKAFTDSTDVLGWIQSHSSRWKTFVANRVTDIQEQLPADQWGHVKGIDNPADCASRGLDPHELLDHPLWWTGPKWLSHGEIPITGKVYLKSTNIDIEEKKVKVCVNAAVQHDDFILCKFSSMRKLLRVSAWCKRFWYNFKLKSKDERRRGPLTPAELEDALLVWIRRIQEQAFSAEINSLTNSKPVSNKSKLRPLNPFLDPSGILRVGGRLRHAILPIDQKTPILLPRHHMFTALLIMSSHLEHFHAGPQLLQSIINRRFWIIGARDAIRHRLKKCVTCTRHNPSIMQQFMGDLPSARVTAARAFLRCGVDYAGPFLLKPITKRSKITYKAYLALFVCLTTRAVHLELVSSLSTEAFIATLRRFIARRGKPSDMYSDAGTNFVGAARELKEMISVVRSSNHNNKVADALSHDGIQWHFNPPGAPHFGGLWEAGVKSVKHHLFRVVGSTRLTFEEMTTTLAQIEACLNSRPLTPFSSDPSDLAVLTPGHFLIGSPLTAAPDPDVTSLNLGRLSRWQLVQQLYQSFWKRWSNEFITRLQQRPKWLNHPSSIKIDDLVLIKDERLPPLRWKLGRVIFTHPGADGVIRVVTLKTADGELKRPIAKLCLLPIDPIKDSDPKVTSENTL